MSGTAGHRVYLDWNATAPLRPEARAAMLAAMDAVGNPSSVHAEGRAARAIVERARGQVAALAGCEPAQVVFTSGATEAAAFLGRVPTGAWVDGADILVPDTAHDCLWAHASMTHYHHRPRGPGHVLAMGLANGETGVLSPLPARDEDGWAFGPLRASTLLLDGVQAAGRVPFDHAASGADYSILSAHKLGGPKGAGALVLRPGAAFDPLIRGGGQEGGRRSGTENVIGIAGFGAAAEAANRELEDGAWERVARLRDGLEERLETAAPDLIFIGRGAQRLPNTACFALPGWAGETQVMQMDLAGFAVSAGAACSSGKVEKASRVLRAMGFDEMTASSAIRVSMGTTTTEAEVMGFAEAWIDRYRRRNSRAA